VFERIIGVCTSNRDPEMRGRIKFRADAVLDGADYPHWAEPVMPPGMFLRPEPGDLVEVLLPKLDDIVESPEFVFWTGRLFSNRSPVHAEFQSDPPTKTGYKTPAGHLLLFDDSEDAETITLLHKGGSRVEIRASGEVVVYDGDGEEPLVKRSEFNDFITNDFNAHGHLLTSGSVPITGPAGSTPLVGSSLAPTAASEVDGTTILKAK
jgi:hypothetical protein